MGVLFCYILSSTMGKPPRKSKKEPEDHIDDLVVFNEVLCIV